MADFKSVIDIDVNDDSFKQFKAMFDGYMTKLKDQGGIWKDQNKALERTQQIMAAMNSKMVEVNKTIESVGKGQKSLSNEIGRSGNGMHKLNNESKGVAKNITEATKSLLKWTGILSGLGGLFIAGGLFGIDRLAANAASQQRQASGLGMSVGATEAFKTRFGGFVNPDAFVNAVNSAQFDPARQSVFRALGINAPGQMNPADLNIEVLKRLRQKWQENPSMHNPMWMRALGLESLGIDFQDWRRIGTSPDFGYEMGQYQKDKSALNVSPGLGIGWKHFSENMTVQGMEFINVFKRALIGLAGPLTNLSSAIVKATSKIMSSPFMKSMIGGLASGIQSAASYISGPDFQDDMEDVLSILKDIFDVLAKAFKWIMPENFATTSGAIAGMAAKYNNPALVKELQAIRHAHRGQADLGVDRALSMAVNPGKVDFTSRFSGVKNAAAILEYFQQRGFTPDQSVQLYEGHYKFKNKAQKSMLTPYQYSQQFTPSNVIIYDQTGAGVGVSVNGVAHQ